MVRKTECRIEEKINDQGKLIERSWSTADTNAPHREDGPALEKFDPESGKLIYSMWINQDEGGRHRKGCKAAYEEIDPRTDVIYLQEYFVHSLEHRADGPAKIYRNRMNNVIVREEFYQDGYLNRDCDLPVVIEYDPDTGAVNREEYYFNDTPHRQNGPAVIEYDSKGNVTCVQYFTNGKEQRPPTNYPISTP